MQSLRILPRAARFLTVTVGLLATLGLASSAIANNNNNNNQNQNQNQNAVQGVAGIEVDAAGVLQVRHPDPRVTRQRLMAARQLLPPNLARPSKLRKVSLTRLEAAMAKRLAAGQDLTPEMYALAGLTRLEYVFFYPETGDIVLAGPAEGFGQDAVGRLVGIESGRPTLLLTDLAVALRAFAPNSPPTPLIGVSIDPTQQGLERMQNALRALGTTIRSPQDVPRIVNTLRNALGLNEVTVYGVPAGTHFAHALAEADYRMKLIGIGLEPPPVPMVTYVMKLSSSTVGNNALIRWYFVPDYKAIATSDDGMSMQLVGQGVKLVGEDELVNPDGTRRATGRSANPASRAYTTEFTKKFPAIAAHSVVYGQLRNLVDMVIAAAFIQDRDLYGKAGWDLGVLGDEDAFPVQVLPAPRSVETAVNAVFKGNRLFTPIGGGVTIQARQALNPDNVQVDEEGKISQIRQSLGVHDLPADQWWWD